MQEVSNRKITQYFDEKGFLIKDDLIINEHVLKLFINDDYYTTYYCTPSLLEELVLGNLAINGLIKQREDLAFSEVREDFIKVNLNINSPRLEELESNVNPQISATNILRLMNKHLDSSPLHKSTGGTHVMSIATNEEILYTCQDIGRHNALDKLFGCCLKNDIKVSDKILLSSGRITNEICYKAVKMGIKIVVSRATVSSLAIDLAEEHDLTILGFTRVNRFNIYTNPQRIIE